MYQAPRGTSDILPITQNYWQFVRDTVERCSDLFGYGRIDTPAFEDTRLFLRTVGSETDIVQKDEQDIGLRKILNFGHTAGHAIESYFDYQISHGIGVFYGMKVAAKISLELNKLTKNQYVRIIELINSFNIKSLDKIKIDKILEFMYYDKKSSHNKINYIILNDIGSSTINSNTDVEIIKKGLSVL